MALDDPLYRYSFFVQDRQEKLIIRSMQGLEEFEGDLIALCQSLVDRFDWIQKRDFRAQIRSGDFPEWI